MKTKKYNQLQSIITILNNRFTDLRLEREGIYKIYDLSMNVLSEDQLEILKEFSDVSLKNLYKKDVLSSLPTTQNEYFTKPLVIVLDEELHISDDVEIALYYFIVSELSVFINLFIEFLQFEQDKYNGFMYWEDDGGTLVLKRTIHENFDKDLLVTDYGSIVWHLFAQVTNIIRARNMSEVEIDIAKIKKVMSVSKEYDFEILRKKLL